MVTPTNSRPPVPIGLHEILTTFGNPHDVDFERRNIVPVNLPYPLYYQAGFTAVFLSKIRVHRLIAPTVYDVFDAISRHGLIAHAQWFGGSYNKRLMRGTLANRWSTHAWGIAIDLNPQENPLGGQPKMDPHVVKLFTDHGFVWGGSFKRRDGMHFQYARGY